MTSQSGVTVQCEGVSFAYRGVPAVEGVSATWPLGVTGLLGVNGAGKSTLMKLIVGLQRPDAGRITVGSASSSGSASLATLRRSVGYLPQDPTWPGSFTVAELVRYFAYLRAVPREQHADRVDEVIRDVGLQEQRDTQLKRLSGGMRRRALVAQAMVHHPALLVLDEPTAGLDPEQRVSLRRVLRRVATTTAVLVSTHLVEDLVQTADRVDVMDVGRLVWQGTVDELVALDDPGDPRLRSMGDTPAERGFARVRRMATAGRDA